MAVALRLLPLHISIDKINSTPLKQNKIIHISALTTRSRSSSTPPINTQPGAKYCNQIALAADPWTMADINDQTMTAKQIIIGSIGHCHAGRRIMGSKISTANPLRQKASITPRMSSGQPSNQGALAKKPLVLHKTAASTICTRPSHGLPSFVNRFRPSSIFELPLNRSELK